MWQFWKGYVIIQIEGLCAARFLKRCTDAGIRVTGVRRTDAASIRCAVPVRRFYDLRKLKRGLPLRIRIVGRRGLPFQIAKLKKRPVLWLGSLLLFSAILFFSTRIWFIRIQETPGVDPSEILEALKERGIFPGAYLKGPILITAANDLSAQIRNAAWIGLDREGVTLQVNVVEALPESPKKTQSAPSDIVAEKDGVITSVQVMRGQARVKPGDRVKKGDVLISGTVLYKDQAVGMAADGTVSAAVQYCAESELMDRITESYETDAAETLRIMRFWGLEIVRTKPSFSHYRLTGPASVTANGLLPFTVETQTVREIGFRDRTLSPEESEQYALTEAREQAYLLVPHSAAILHTYGTIRKRDGKSYACVIVTAEEIIGKTEELPHDG